ncbi:hypothetical protein D3C84_773440 [compost metagenome]
MLDKMHQPHAPRLVAIEPRRRQRQAPGLSQADALDHKRRDLRGQHAEAGFRQPELRLMIRQGDIADAGQAQTAAKHCALQHGDHHLRCVLHLLQQRAERTVQITVGVRALSTGVGHVLDVATGTEMSTGTADHQGPNRTVIAHGQQHRAQFGDHLQAHGVSAFRAVEGDMQHAVMRFEQ